MGVVGKYGKQGSMKDIEDGCDRKIWIAAIDGGCGRWVWLEDMYRWRIWKVGVGGCCGKEVDERRRGGEGVYIGPEA